MVRVFCVVALFVGCGFEGYQGAVSDAAIDDSAIVTTIDAPIAQPDAQICKLRAKPGTLELRGRVGGDGGPNETTLTCPNDEFPIGFGFDMSDQITNHGDRSAYKVTMQCAPLVMLAGTADPLRVGTLSQVVSKTALGNSGWTPATPTGIAMAPANTMMVGLRAFTGITRPDATNNKNFLNISIRFRQISDLQTFGPDQQSKVLGTYDATIGLTEAACNDDEVLSGVVVKSGTGIDSLTLQCVKLDCAQ
jgi:hypothetical protein